MNQAASSNPPQAHRYPPRFVAVAICAIAWGALYALYRAYYGFGGDVGMIGVPASQARF